MSAFKMKCPKCGSFNVDLEEDHRAYLGGGRHQVQLHCYMCGFIMYGEKAIQVEVDRQFVEWQRANRNKPPAPRTPPPPPPRPVPPPPLDDDALFGDDEDDAPIRPAPRAPEKAGAKTAGKADAGSKPAPKAEPTPKPEKAAAKSDKPDDAAAAAKSEKTAAKSDKAPAKADKPEKSEVKSTKSDKPAPSKADKPDPKADKPEKAPTKADKPEKALAKPSAKPEPKADKPEKATTKAEKPPETDDGAEAEDDGPAHTWKPGDVDPVTGLLFMFPPTPAPLDDKGNPVDPCHWPPCENWARPNSKYCSRNCSNKNARARYAKRKV